MDSQEPAGPVDQTVSADPVEAVEMLAPVANQRQTDGGQTVRCREEDTVAEARAPTARRAARKHLAYFDRTKAAVDRPDLCAPPPH